MSDSGVESLLAGCVPSGCVRLGVVLDVLGSGRVERWLLPVPVLLEIRGAGAGVVAGGDHRWPRDSEDPREVLRWSLARLGVAPGCVELFALAAETAGVLERGGDLSQVRPREGVAVTDPDVKAVDGGGASALSGGDAGECGAGQPDLAVRVAGASRVLGLVEVLTGLGARLEGLLVAVVSDLTARHGRVLLAGKGLEGVSELTAEQARRWRARAKSVTRREIAAATGWGQGESADLVALATAPAPVREPVGAAMAAGVVPWRLARRFLREFGHHGHEDAAAVAQRLFGTEPARVCTDRLDPEGNLQAGPWQHRLFYRAVEAEATRLAGRDPAAAAAARRHARDRRDVRALVHPDGTGSVTVHGTATQVAAVADRIEKAARAARAAGDARSLAHLRADIAMSLLMHSVLNLPDPPEPPPGTDPPPETPADTGDTSTAPDGDSGSEGKVRTAWSEQMRAVLAALPPAVLNVIVPFDALVHSPHRPLPFTTSDGGTGGTGDVAERQQGAAAGPEVLSVGLVTGAFPQFLTPDAVRELALTPGATLYRLVMDPVDGRAVERSITRYAPDAHMRAQVHAADVTCRAPGCVQHAPYTQLDHVIPYGTPGGTTTETNLMDLHPGHHDPKTAKEWSAVMTTNRDVTWTSLLHRIYRTRAHDYRTYSTLYRRTLARIHDQRDHADTDHAGTDPRHAHADAVDFAIYQALTYRGPARPLRAGDDHPDTDVDPAYLGWDLITLTHTTPDGQRRYTPDPTLAQSERTAQHDAAGDHHDRSHPTQRQPTDPVRGATDRPGSPTEGWRHTPDHTPPPF